MKLKHAEIIMITGDPMSGLWQLFTTKGMIHIESGTGVRNLAAAYGAHEGSGDLMRKIQGQKIFYSADEFGVLNCFIPDNPHTRSYFEGLPDVEFGKDEFNGEYMIIPDQA